MQPDERRLPAGRADHQRDMFNTIVAGAKGDDLGRREAVERESGASDDLRIGAEVGDCGGIDPRSDIVDAIEQPKRRKQPGQPRENQRGACAVLCRAGGEWPDRRAIEIAAGIDQRARGGIIEPARSHDPHRLAGIGGIAGIAEAERRCPRSADQQVGAAVRVEQLEHGRGRGFDREDHDRRGAVDRHRATSAKRGDRPLDRGGLGQIRNTLTSGT